MSTQCNNVEELEAPKKKIKCQENAHQDEDHAAKIKLALQRWNILRQALISGRSSMLTCQSTASVRRFKSFNLLQTHLLPQQEGDNLRDGDWYNYTCNEWSHFNMCIRHLSGIVKTESLMGFNNTGNVCVWPAEEVLTYYCLKNAQDFRDKTVIELGGGMTCLAGVALSVVEDVRHVELTDGNEESVLNLEAIINRNSTRVNNTSLSSRLFRWGSGPMDADLSEKFDFVLCADCLFFDDGREDLVESIYSLLNSTGIAILIAPRRGDTFDIFVSLARTKFHVEVMSDYDDRVTKLNNEFTAQGLDHYDPNIHYPLFMKLQKIPESRENSSER